MGYKLLIFGGTTEGRELAVFCAENGVDCGASVTTEYGASLLPEGMIVHTGRLDSGQMRELISANGYTAAVDATHPYAVEATENIAAACKAAGIPCMRLLRETSEIRGTAVESMAQLIDILNGCGGRVLSTLGSKALPELAAVNGCYERIWVRVLPAEGMTEHCAELGFDERKVILGKGPFTAEQNVEHLRMSGAEILVTKESGAAGGYPEKAEAAERCGVRLITLVRPREQGLTAAEMRAAILRQKELCQ